jgi:transcriptional regulator with XRE-family HTH domain
MNCIKEVLKKQGRTQSWLATQIGKSYVVTTNYCNNKTQPSSIMLGKIAEILGVKSDDLIIEPSRFTSPGYIQKKNGMKQYFDLDVTL